MKRSEIQAAIAWAKSLLERSGFALPMFAHWSLEQWKARREEVDTIIKTMRGWDVTTFGHEDFTQMGAVLFTIRNGLPDGSAGCPYAEKLILMKEGQVLPNHYHAQKTEDIINRGGGVLLIKVYGSLPDGSVDRESDVRILMDGIESTVPAGTVVEVTRGNSMTIYPGLYHLFTPKPGCGDLIVGEVSSINDDNTDNYFEDPRSRFIPVEEDEPVTIPLCNEYRQLLG
ncbi:MAG: D-lyxose/D-mannose family sugar isomerase [Clostridiales bacterium]|nr:D-lyxose/D-mannose family sugar isomerase [Clostridiales bacterium]